MKNVKWMPLPILLILTLLAPFQMPASSATDLTNFLPILAVTPGAVNPAVTQSNIGSTICTSGYTKTIRPSSSYTTSLKIKQLTGTYKRYGSSNTSLFEEDHLIPLEIGGNPTSEKNLWAEYWDGTWGAYTKDKLENKIHSLVCSGALSLSQGQAIFASNWISGYNTYVLGQATPSVSQTPTPQPSPSSTVTSQITFVMPLFTDRIGLVVASWGRTGFSNPPIIIQDSVPTGLACKPSTDNDIIVKQEPKWKDSVSSDTQVTLTIMCNAYVVKGSVASPQASTTLTPSPAQGVTTASPSSTSGAAATLPSSQQTPDHPASATGKCKDGSFSYAVSHSGMCSKHGGVAQYYP